MNPWILTDPLDSSTYTMPHNPNRSSSPDPVSRSTETFAPVGADVPYARSSRGLTEWSFGGRYYTAAEIAALRDWMKRKRLLLVTNHLGRTYEVVVRRLDPVERIPTRRRENHGEWTATVSVIRRVS